MSLKKITIRHVNKQRVECNGTINIISGHFRSYGQDLIIKKGQLIFSNPIDHPFLNIEAIRNPDVTEDDVIVGIQVIGLIDQPKLKVFSNPIKSKQETLSYLLLGQDLYSSMTDSNAMTSMLIRIGISQSEQAVDKIGQAFGINKLALSTQGIGYSSQIVVSGYITPVLQIKYGVGVFDSLATLTVRYRLMPKLYLETVSSLNQAFNILYRFEF